MTTTTTKKRRGKSIAPEPITLFGFMRQLIRSFKSNAKWRSAETYAAALSSFSLFRKGKDLCFSELSPEILASYEAFLKAKGTCKNTSSFYMRILRAALNKAIARGIAPPSSPFRDVYTGVDSTAKRAISIAALRRIKCLDLSASPLLDFARDMFLFCFYTRGMSMIDMAFLARSNISGGILRYRRKKTGRLLQIRWEQCMQDIVDKHYLKGQPFLLPIIKLPAKSTQRRQYLNASHCINRQLKKVGELAQTEIPLTMYVGRHTWASLAQGNNVPLSVISQGMGHDSEKTTRIYLASIDARVVDEANSKLIELI